MRTTIADVRIAFCILQDTASALGVDGAEHWHLEPGSTTYGRAFRIFRRDPETGALHATGAADYLGMTRREALHTLRGLTDGLRLAAGE